MTPEDKPRDRRRGERHATAGQTKGEAQVAEDQGKSHGEVAALVREADRFALQLPVVGRVPIPRPDQLAFYGTLGALVIVEMVDWPVALAIGAAHALFADSKQRSSVRRSDEPE
jgi:hypothetical protein